MIHKIGTWRRWVAARRWPSTQNNVPCSSSYHQQMKKIDIIFFLLNNSSDDSIANQTWPFI